MKCFSRGQETTPKLMKTNEQCVQNVFHNKGNSIFYMAPPEMLHGKLYEPPLNLLHNSPHKFQEIPQSMLARGTENTQQFFISDFSKQNNPTQKH